MNIALRSLRRSTDTSHIEIRLATHDDVPAIAQMFGAYFHATQWAYFLSYDEDKTIKRLHELIAGKRSPHLLAFDGHRLVGVLSWHYDNAYVREPIGVMDETYVDPEYRHTNLGRKLVGLALHLAHGDGAPVFNFPIASGLPETRTLVNMLRKFGGEVCGVLVRCVPQGGPHGR